MVIDAAVPPIRTYWLWCKQLPVRDDKSDAMLNQPSIIFCLIFL